MPPKAEEHGASHTFPRVTEELPPETAEIKPHPHGVELGVLMQMFRDTDGAQPARAASQSDFSRVSARTARRDLRARGRARRAGARRRSRARRPRRSTRAIQATKIMAPPTDCIAPIGEELIERALRAEVEADFYAAVTRRADGLPRQPVPDRGRPRLRRRRCPAEEPITLYRFANRVPLQYQQGACAITKAVIGTDWKAYELQQPRGALPVGPMLLMVHIASVWVPFTSESKEAIARYPEIIKEMRLALQECGRRVAMYIRKRRRDADEAKKRAYIEKYIPQIGDRPAGDPRAHRRAARRRDHASLTRRARAQPEGCYGGEEARRRRRRQTAAQGRRRQGGSAARARTSRERNAAQDDAVVLEQIRDAATERPPGDPEAARSPSSRSRCARSRTSRTARTSGYFEIGRAKKVRTLTVNTVKSFAQTLRMMALSKELVETQRLRDQARRLLPEQELGRGASSTSRPSRTR